ncbi:MAG: hypothetical protein V1758_06175 [Pseudomonadota bacterium]
MDSLEKFERRFGSVAIEKGFITVEQLIESLKIQVMENLEGMHRPVGAILFSQKLITLEQIKAVLKTLGVY